MLIQLFATPWTVARQAKGTQTLSLERNEIVTWTHSCNHIHIKTANTAGASAASHASSPNQHAPQVTVTFIFITTDLLFLFWSSCKWNYRVCSLLWLASLTQHYVFEIYPYICIAVWYSTECMLKSILLMMQSLVTSKSGVLWTFLNTHWCSDVLYYKYIPNL